MFIRNVCLITAFVVAGPAMATFEIKDPAAEIYAEEQAMANPGLRSCFDLLVDSVERPAVYRAAVNWVREAVGGNESTAATEAALRSFCIDNPKRSVADAAATLSAAPGGQSGS